MRSNQKQFEAWNGGESVHYVDHSDRYDRQLVPFSDALLARAGLESHHSVLDIGCGCGATTLRAAGLAHRAVGADLSEPLVEIARHRARASGIGNAEFVIADAQTHLFGSGTFDVIISQFGVMFFDEPMTAFVNLRRALAPGGRAIFVCWQGLQANEWLMLIGQAVAEHVVLPHFGGQAGGPGMFSLCDPTEVTTVLHSAGFEEFECDPLVPSVLVGGGGTLDESIDFLLGMGMVRGLVGLAGPDAHDAVIDTVRRELAERYEPNIGLRVGTAAWLVSAQT
ncbi:MAG: class I SAM-dependent methyltransferase [Acidimicrobiales bacterium]